MKHHPTYRSFLGFAFGLCALGCADQVTDTEKRTFSIKCEHGDCLLTLAEDGSSDAEPQIFKSVKKGRVLKVCPQDQDDARHCKPLTCGASPAACATLGGAGYSCEKNLCQNQAVEVSYEDKVALCLAGTGQYKRTPKQLEQVTIAKGCRAPGCEVPAMCMGL